MSELIIRGEHPISHRGVFNHFHDIDSLMDTFSWVWEHNDIHGNHPIPSLDNIQPYCPRDLNLQCGFISLLQMRNWFEVYQRRDILDKGFNFYWFEPSGQVFKGGHQCLFKRAEAKLIRPCTMEELEL